jgi:ferredoxin
VVEAGTVLNDPGGSGSLAEVPPRFERDVVESAEVCPGECIFIEVPVPAVGPGSSSALPSDSAD